MLEIVSRVAGKSWSVIDLTQCLGHIKMVAQHTHSQLSIEGLLAEIPCRCMLGWQSVKLQKVKQKC